MPEHDPGFRHATIPALTLGREVVLPRAAEAMVWSGVGLPLDAVAVPGVLLGRGDVLVEVELTTVCGSDVHTALGHRPADRPLVLGHEQVGHIVAVAEQSYASNGMPLRVGQRVVWSVTVSCGTCQRCRRGVPQKCLQLAKYGHERMRRGWELSGGFATHVQVRAGTAVVVVDEQVPATVLAPASCATATVVAALGAASALVPLAGATVLVTGAGMLGLTACAMATDAGALVVVSDPDAARRQLALAFGAAAVADPGAPTESPTGVASVLTALLQAGAAEPTVALELSGARSAVQCVLDLIGVGGVVVLVGSVSPGEAVPLDPESIVRRLVTVRGVHNYTPDDLAQAVTYLSGAWHRHPFSALVGAIFDLSQADAALLKAATACHPRVGLSPQPPATLG
ncbi:alcohol dehydrogenase catalytic domain-containing protein [Cryobacterium luteum]|uniref:alcohol dehydrogenase n=1 Tax=Cryobacterium luteum TaxID=1424661 RepID=A0A1H8HBP4_9MICO|nr:alcohol dehydrogenase catalytic domain-containing protein [Cryobacterium luteum]TFB86732.1 alcohol dehydrogenase [Cryobacterium luteum]SEN52998.1 putative phosphonate catabolism associated alcohol dehydrogenase [Cryobacterium luteum]